jgi:hypothetical protein
MSLTPENEPRRPRTSGIGWGWLVPFLLVAPTIIREVQRRTTLSNEQLIMIVAGVGALIVLAVVSRRAFASERSTPRLPTYDANRPSYTPQAPRFEPMVTGKVLLAGLALGALFALGVVLLLTML